MTELIAFFGIMKALGFDMAKIMEVMVVFFMVVSFFGLMAFVFRKPLYKFFKAVYTAMEAMPKLETSVVNLNSTLQEHIVQTDLRMDEGEKKFTEIKLEIKEIKNHLKI